MLHLTTLASAGPYKATRRLEFWSSFWKVDRHFKGAPLNADTLQIRQLQLFATVKIAMRSRFDNVINALRFKDVCCGAMRYGDIANNHDLWRL